MQHNTIADRLKALRNKLMLSQTDFGKMIGKNYHSVMRWELGKVLPPANVAEHICRTFGVSSVWLMNGTGEMFTAKKSSDAAESENVRYSHETNIQIPYFLKLPASFPDYSQDDVHSYIKLISTESGCFAMSAPADCASPIMADDTVIFSTVNDSDDLNGKLCIISGKYGDVFIRRVDTSSSMLVSKKPDYPDIPCEGCKVLGIVREILRKIIF